MKASRIDVASAEHDLLEDEDGSMTDPDGVLRAVELFRQQQRQQQQQADSGALLTMSTASPPACFQASSDCLLLSCAMRSCHLVLTISRDHCCIGMDR